MRNLQTFDGLYGAGGTVRLPAIESLLKSPLNFKDPIESLLKAPLSFNPNPARRCAYRIRVCVCRGCIRRCAPPTSS